MSEVHWKRYVHLSRHKLARKQLLVECSLGLAQNTIDTYARGREEFFLYCSDKRIRPEAADREQIALWVRSLLLRHKVSRSGQATPSPAAGLSNSTLHLRITAVRLFFDFAIEQGHRADNPVGRGRYTPGRPFVAKEGRGIVPRYHKLPWIPNEDQWQLLIRRLQAEAVRNKVMFLLAYDAALRREELCSLRIDDFDFAHRLLTVRAEVAKGRHERTVPYSMISAALLGECLRYRRSLTLAPGALFLSESRRNRAEPITIWTWSKVVERLARESDVRRFTTHTSRHLCLTDLARSGWDLHEIATFAGHKSIETTKAYIHLSQRDLVGKIERGMDRIHQWRLKLLEEAFK
jgi:site-specific recombinase XerD